MKLFHSAASSHKDIGESFGLSDSFPDLDSQKYIIGQITLSSGKTQQFTTKPTGEAKPSTPSQIREMPLKEHTSLDLLSIDEADVNDESILQAFLTQDFILLGKLRARKKGRVQITATDLALLSDQHRLKQKLTKAIVTRKLVSDPVNCLLDAANYTLLASVVKLGLVRLTKDEVKRMLSLKLSQTVLEGLRRHKQTWLSTHKLLRRFDIIAEVCSLFKNIKTTPSRW
jgi:hypothetical protein